MSYINIESKKDCGCYKALGNCIHDFEKNLRNKPTILSSTSSMPYLGIDNLLTKKSEEIKTRSLKEIMKDLNNNHEKEQELNKILGE